MSDPTKKSKPSSAANAEERAFLAAYDAAAFPHPSVAVDVAVMSVADGALHTLLVQRGDHPQKGRLALPGGFVGVKESLDAAAARVLAIKTGLRDLFLEQLYTFGDVGRDPRTRVITVAYYALVDRARVLRARPEQGAMVFARIDVPWKGEAGGPVRALDAEGRELPLAFDHADILGVVVKRLRGKLGYVPIGYELLPRRFALRQLQEIHEAVLGRKLNKDSFRRSVVASGLVAPTRELEHDVPYRPAELYRYVRSKSR
ncbi:MAG: NUDIX domain-containing protein [Planctomycetes bacterium]|nr:NUDIX domain-containing protein [Planctomycetota bacterium]MBI3846628.1 NUDIX domain-containing protein [Planctomycetota bacterium]